MNAALRNAFIAAGLMLAAGAAAVALQPTVLVADAQHKVDLETMVPKQFGQWRLDPRVIPIAASPDVQASLNAIYNQILLRTYVDPDGHQMMLLIAYGADQRGEDTQVHRPEFCYTAQGFQLLKNTSGELATDFGPLPVRRLIAVQERRQEPLTYWITVGDKATLPGFGRKLHQIAYGLTGKIADGMLVRISSIDTDTARAYRLQEEFVRQLLASVTNEARAKLIGFPHPSHEPD